MKAKAPGSTQRTSRARIAAALCAAGIVAGTLSSNLVGAGADNQPAPVPGEPVAAQPTQVAPAPGNASGTEAEGAQAAATPADASATTTPAAPSASDDPATTTDPAPPIATSATPSAPTTTTPAPATQPPVPVAAPAPTPGVVTPAIPTSAPASQPAAGEAVALGAPAGAAQPAGDEQPCATSSHATSTRAKRPATTTPCAPRKPTPTIGKTAADPAEPITGDRTDAQGHVLRDDQGVPTLANPTTSLAFPGPAAVGVPNFFIDKFRIPVFLLPIYQAAGIQYGVRWEVLAAINEIETDYGRNLNVSSAGALGWMQFMPDTWKRYGVDANRDGKKDPFNPVDAIFAAARYLKAAGAQHDLRGAIFSYNHANWYVESVLMRARMIAGLPHDLVGSLSGLTQGRFPVYAKARYADDLSEQHATRRVAPGTNAAMPIEGSADRHGIDIFAVAGSPVIAVQDGRITAVGHSRHLGRFIRLTDVYGNTYTYAHLAKVATRVAVPKPATQSKASIDAELALPKADPKPTQAATAGHPTHTRAQLGPAMPRVAKAVAVKQRLFAHPSRPNALAHGGARQLLELGSSLAQGQTLKSYFIGDFGLSAKDVVLKPLIAGRRVIAGTILGRIGRTSASEAPHVRFEIRPSGRGAPQIDPKPILDGWKLLEATAIYRARGANPLAGAGASDDSIGQIMLMSKEALGRRVLSDPRIDIYSCGRRDIEAGGIDRRVLATLEFLAASGLKPTVSSLHCGHGYYTASGNVSEHSTGDAVDIAAINGIPILGHQGVGSITDITIRRLLTLQGTMKPHQIISLMTFPGTDNTLALPDHYDHIHVGFHPDYAPGTPEAKELASVLKPAQWVKLIDRLGAIENPTVATKPSKYAIGVPAGRASTAHRGE